MVWLSEGQYLPGCRAQDKGLKVWNLKPVTTQLPSRSQTANAQRKSHAWTAARTATIPVHFHQVPPVCSCQRGL